MFEDHNGDRLSAFVTEPHAVSPSPLPKHKNLNQTLLVRILQGCRTQQARNSNIEQSRRQVLDASVSW